jgi:hypothetical protein
MPVNKETNPKPADQTAKATAAQAPAPEKTLEEQMQDLEAKYAAALKTQSLDDIKAFFNTTNAVLSKIEKGIQGIDLSTGTSALVSAINLTKFCVLGLKDGLAGSSKKDKAIGIYDHKTKTNPKNIEAVAKIEEEIAKLAERMAASEAALNEKKKAEQEKDAAKEEAKAKGDNSKGPNSKTDAPNGKDGLDDDNGAKDPKKAARDIMRDSKMAPAGTRTNAPAPIAAAAGVKSKDVQI